MKIIRSLVAASALLAWPFAVVACGGPAGGGGCPWTHASVAVEPSTPCLSAHVLNADGRGSNGGCVDPDVVVTNACTASLVVENVAAESPSGAPLPPPPASGESTGAAASQTATIPMDGTGAFQFDIETGGTGDHTTVAANLGGNYPLVFAFTLSR